MALVLADRVKETTTTAGTGTVTLLGAATGFQSFAVIGNANTTFYTIAGQTGNEWEVGVGTYTSSGTTLARTTVLSNSAGTQPSALSFSAGTKDVFVTYPSGKSVNLDASGNSTALGTPVSVTLTNASGLPLSTGVTGQLPVANGGTGLTAGTSGGVLAYTASGTLASSAALTQYGVVYGGGAGAVPVATAAGTTGQVLTATTSGAPSWASPATSGTVTAVSVASTNGFAGTSSGGATPALTLSTSITGVLKGNGTAISAAVAGTDYVAISGALGTPSSGTLTNTSGLPLTSGVTGTLPAANGGTGVANNAAMTVTGSGNFAYTRTLTGTTNVTFPTTGTLATLAGSETLTNKTIAFGSNTISGTLAPANGGTGVANNAAMTVTGSGNFAYTRTLTAATNVTFPTTGTLATLAGTETLSNKTFTAPALGTPASGIVTNLTGTASININGTVGATTANTGVFTNAQITSLGVGTAASGTTGEIRATNNVTAYYSDDRLKTRLGSIENALDKVRSLDTFYYEANDVAQSLGYEPIREVGISAQQVQAIMPETVAPAPIDEKYLTVRYERLVPLLLAAIKELEAEVKALKARV